MGNQCKECMDRHVGCHAKCEIYARFRRDLDERKKTIQGNRIYLSTSLSQTEMKRRGGKVVFSRLRMW